MYSLRSATRSGGGFSGASSRCCDINTDNAAHAKCISKQIVRLLIAFLFLAAFLFVSFAKASEKEKTNGAKDTTRIARAGVSLIMIEEIGCPFCDRWHREIGEVYPRTPEGRFAPLTTVFIHDRAARRFKRVVYTPTFIVMARGQEVGRIVGYQGEDFFWSMLEEILKKAGYKPGRNLTQ